MSDLSLFNVLQDVSDERIRQINKWGPQHHDDPTWMLILGEEVGEVAKSIIDRIHSGKTDIAETRKELVQVAAVAVAWLECLDNKK